MQKTMSKDLGEIIASFIPEGYKINKKTGESHPQKLTPSKLTELLSDACQVDIKLTYCQLTKQCKLNNFLDLKSDDFDFFFVKLAKRGWMISKGDAKACLMNGCLENQYHPVKNYLTTGIMKIQPVDIDRLATNYLGTNSALYDEMLKKTLIGAVSRIFKPACKMDYLCVLKGDQGIKKSTFWRVLCEGEHFNSGWFCDTPQENRKDLMLTIHTCWIYEFQELDATTTQKDQGSVKNLITGTSDKFRAPYAATVDDHARASILVGTVNSDDFLRDFTGARRFWVIDLPDKQIDIQRLKKDRDKIWKAAFLEYEKGVLPYLQPHFEEEAAKANENYAPEDPFLQKTEVWLNADAQWMQPFTTMDALFGSGIFQDNKDIKPNTFHLKMMAKTLRTLGFKQKCTTLPNGHKQRQWFKVSLLTRSDEIG